MTTNVTELAKKLDNLTLKQWLHEVGPNRRKEILKKVRDDNLSQGLEVMLYQTHA